MKERHDSRRHLGLFGATMVGVGAIVGGGILALAGVAFANAGPAALVAFAANGAIAVLTALSFAEMSARFPESGGTYTFAKKVLSVEAAFMVGWVVWFASIVAAVLYALGFASFVLQALHRLATDSGGQLPDWLAGRSGGVLIALAAIGVYTVSLIRRSAGGGQVETIGKILVFAVLIVGGLWVLWGREDGTVGAAISPFAPFGVAGIAQAMGYTFIALQGFDLIAAVGGEVKTPGRTIPRAMLLSLAIALIVYLPLLFVLMTVGVAKGGAIAELAAASPDAVVAVAVEHYLGPVGFWLVMVAALLSMLSALQANLFAASRVVLAMARDRTVPEAWGRLDIVRGTPVASIVATVVPVAITLIILPDVAAAGAVSSLIFLVTFAVAHWTALLARRRASKAAMHFRLPLGSTIPIVGGLACLALAVFQGVVVPVAGILAIAWLGLGMLLFASLFAGRARVFDASTEALDPELVRLRGRSPLVLVPVANPQRAEALVEVANALAPPLVGRVLMLSVVRPPEDWQPGTTPAQVTDAQAILERALTVSLATNHAPEALTTIADDVQREIARVADAYRCESLLLGFGAFTADGVESMVEGMLGVVNADVVVLRSPPNWRLSKVERALVPVGGRRDQSDLRARLIGSLTRSGVSAIDYLRLVPPNTSKAACARIEHELRTLSEDEAPGIASVLIEEAEDAGAALTTRANEYDLVVLGLKRLSKQQKVLGDWVIRLARETDCGLIMISRRG